MTRESIETRSKRKARAAFKCENKRRYQARQRKIAEVCKVLTDPYTARALREGITREEAKRRTFGDLYGGSFSGTTTGRMSASGRNLSSVPRTMPNWPTKTGTAPRIRFLGELGTLKNIFEHHVGGKTLKKIAIDTETEVLSPKDNVLVGVDYGFLERTVLAQYSRIDAELSRGLADVGYRQGHKDKRGRKKK